MKKINRLLQGSFNLPNCRVWMVLCLLVLCAGKALGQGIYFSQNNLSPLLYNPAAPALKDEMSLMLNYRNQQSNSQLSIQSLSFNGLLPFYNKDKSRRRGGVGIGLLSDKAEEVSALVNQQAMASVAYNLPFIGKTTLALGAQAAVGQQRFGLENVTTGSQWVNNSGYDPSVGTGESFSQEKKNFRSVGAGFLLYKEREAGVIHYQLGASAYHLNKPQISYMDGQVYMPVNYRAHASLHIPAGSSFALIPELNWQHQAMQQLISLGSVLRYQFVNKNPFDPISSGSLDFIARTNLNESVVFGLQLQQPGYVVGFCFDMGFSSSRLNEPGYHASEFGIAIRKSIGRKSKEIISAGSIGELRELFVEKAAVAKASDPEETKAPGQPVVQEQIAGKEPLPDSGNAPYKGDGVQFELRKEFKFGFNKAELDDEAKTYLDELHELLQNNPHLKVKVIGHTDDVGTGKANKKVSEWRARAVEEYLLSKGLVQDRIKAEGKGDTQPLKPNDSEANRAANRRVEFILYTR